MSERAVLCGGFCTGIALEVGESLFLLTFHLVCSLIVLIIAVQLRDAQHSVGCA